FGPPSIGAPVAVSAPQAPPPDSPEDAMPLLHATYADPLLRAHRLLLRALRDLRAALAQDSAEPADLTGRLEALPNLLSEHFALEEDGGSLPSVVQPQPHLGRAVERLQEEHRSILRDLGAILANPIGDLRPKVEDLIEEIRRHERHENTLVQDAFSLDLAAE